MSVILEVVQLKKYYQNVKAVDDISFSIEQGICFGLLGPNGAGKTTTIEIIEGIISPTSGEVLYKGKQINSRFRQDAGILFQSTALMDFITGREVLQLFSSFYKRTQPIEELADMCHLHDFLDRYATKLSGGQRQRLMLSLAMINDPEIIFLDEPTTGLDPQARRNFWKLVESIKAKGKTIVLTTHYMEEAEILCDNLAIMDEGKIITQGSPQQLLRENFDNMSVHLDRSDFNIDPGSWPEPVTFIENNVEIHTNDIDQTIQRLLDNNINLNSLQVKSYTLEDLFIKLTGHQLKT
ncbi:MAG: ABC transporter ATP-binding protein [Spirochaetota bacterium]|nr:ABC transporter ATP-binding protein [Spirochaetota bacterium]